jgi:hypothetical protein
MSRGTRLSGCADHPMPLKRLKMSTARTKRVIPT